MNNRQLISNVFQTSNLSRLPTEEKQPSHLTICLKNRRSDTETPSFSNPHLSTSINEWPNMSVFSSAKICSTNHLSVSCTVVIHHHTHALFFCKRNVLSMKNYKGLRVTSFNGKKETSVVSGRWWLSLWHAFPFFPKQDIYQRKSNCIKFC